MTFLAPAALFWLLLLVPVIVFFYLLRLRRRQVTVSSVLLWNHLVKDVQANAPFQRLKKNLLLILQLLIAGLAILALARPGIFTRGLGGATSIVILDGSASMQSRDVRAGTRFQEAQRLALDMVSRMRGGDRMLVLLATGRAHRLTALTSDRNELRRAIASAQPADTPTRLHDALLLAASLAGQNSGSTIFVLSDGAFEDLPDLDPRGATLTFVRVGTRSSNVGIVAMDVRRKFRDDGGYQLYVAIRNHSPTARTGNLLFYRNEALIDARTISLAAADPSRGFSEKAQVYDRLPEATGILKAELELQDDLPADNVAYAQLSARRDLRVLLVSRGDLYLEKALNVDPGVKLDLVSPDGYTGQEGYDVVVFENEAPRVPGPGAHLYINCGGSTAPVQIKGKVTQSTIIDWNRTHPVMRYVQLNQVNLAEALTAERRPWGVVLAEHSAGPAIVVGEKGGAKSAFVAFGMLNSDFPLRVAFPIFYSNLIQWLGTRPGRDGGVQIAAGDPAVIEVPPALEEVTVTSPTGERTVARPERNLISYSATDRKGVYQVEGRGFKREFVVNLLSRAESQTTPRDRLKLGNRPVLSGSGSVQTTEEIWRWLLMIALCVLALEWWVYHRRV